MSKKIKKQKSVPSIEELLKSMEEYRYTQTKIGGCPSCGFCPTCGRQNQDRPSVPHLPVVYSTSGTGGHHPDWYQGI